MTDDVIKDRSLVLQKGISLKKKKKIRDAVHMVKRKE